MSFQRRAYVIALAALALAASAGCAHKIQRGGELATQGAIRGAKTKLKDMDPDKLGPLTVATTRAAVDTLLEQLESEDNQRRLQQLVMAASEAALRGITEQQRAALVRFSDDITTSAIHAVAGELRGPLRQGLGDTTRTISSSVVAGARDELTSIFPECVDGDRRACVAQRIKELSHAASVDIGRGVADGLKSALLGVAFLAGAALALLVTLLVRVFRHAPHDAPRPGARPHDARPAPSY